MYGFLINWVPTILKKIVTGLTRVNKTHVLVPLILSETLFASQQLHAGSESALNRDHHHSTFERYRPDTAKGLIVFDYEVIPLPDDESIDLFGMRYLHQLNQWIYFGLGVHAPLVNGNYGGFMTIDATIHAQEKIFEDLFVNAGASLGGGGGGSSVAQSKELSGTGGFVKSYIGLGYEFDNNVSLGLNYAHFKFEDSQIDSSQLNFFIQKSLSYSLGSYASAGRKVQSTYHLPESDENILILEMNNIFQIDPTASNKENIHSVSLQFSHFFNSNNYLFFEADVGYKGRPLYNQIVHGIGHRFFMSPRVNLYSQIGVGSGGYAPSVIDTGSGLLIYPKVSLEYLLGRELGLSISGGYLVAPTGSSKNYTLGAAINYHLSGKQKNAHGFNTANDLRYKGFRVSIFPQTEFDVNIADKDHHNINMLSTQLDNLLNGNWYFATQVSVAYNDFQGLPGYGEILAGVGLQNRYAASKSFQNFFQILIGANVHGVIFKPAIGTNYSLNDHFALYGQISKTMSVDIMNLYREDKSFSAYSVGAGVTYRFSLL